MHDSVSTLQRHGANIKIDDDDATNEKLTRNVNVRDVHVTMNKKTFIVRGVPNQYDLVLRNQIMRINFTIARFVSFEAKSRIATTTISLR